MNIIRQWRNVKLAKRHGKGHDPKGIDSTSEGELAMLCRSCPHPGINLPEGWDKAPRAVAYVFGINYGLIQAKPSDSFIYTLFLCMDANFRQKNRYRATTYEDVSLSDGWAYFVKSSPYMEYISTFATQEEVSTWRYHVQQPISYFCSP